MRWATSYQATKMQRAVLAALLTLASTSCGDRIAWTDPMSLPSALGDERLTVDESGRVRVVRDTSLNLTPSTDPRVCPGSVRAARQDDATLVSVWWSVREDSSVVLLAALSPDGGSTWRPTVAVDTADASVAGCSRPAPVIAASSGFVHIAYSMKAKEGTGVFYAHSMTHGQSYEAPVAIVYGDRVVQAAVAADKGNVAIAYEDPSGATPSIGLAISRDWGHIFMDRVRGSTGIGPASMPQVAVAGNQIAVSWLQGSRGTDSALRVARIVRVGRLS